MACIEYTKPVDGRPVSARFTIREARILRQVAAWFINAIKEGTTVASAEQNLLAIEVERALGRVIGASDAELALQTKAMLAGKKKGIVP